MRWCLILSILLLSPSVLCLDLSVNFGAEFPYNGYLSQNQKIANFVSSMLADAETDPFGDGFDFLDDFFDTQYAQLYDIYFNSASFAPWPAPRTTLFAPYGSYIGFNTGGFYPFKFGFNGNRVPGEYLGIGFDLPVTELYALFELYTYYVYSTQSQQYYYNAPLNNVFNWPFETNPDDRDDVDELEIIFPFHITAKTVDGYYYYDWLIPRIATFNDDYNIYYDLDDDFDLNGFTREFTVLASDPRGIDFMRVYSMIPENNREQIYRFYNNEDFQLPEYYHWLYLSELIARMASPSSTRTITATTTPSPNFKRHPTFSATESPTITHTITPSASRTPIFKSESNTPTRTPNRSASNTPSSSISPAPPVSPPPSASAPGQSASASRSASTSFSRSPTTPSGTPTVTSTATGTRTSFLTASNTQQPGRNVPSVSIAPSSSPAPALFSQPSGSTAVLVQFNVLCFGYCSGLSAISLQSEIANSLSLDENLVRIVAIHEFFEGDSEITVLICSNSGVDTFLNSVQSGTFVQEYFVSISVESVDWTVRCNMDLYNYEYIPVSSASSVLPLFVLFFLQLWMLA